MNCKKLATGALVAGACASGCATETLAQFPITWSSVPTEFSGHVSDMQTNITPLIMAFVIMAGMLFFGLRLLRRSR